MTDLYLAVVIATTVVIVAWMITRAIAEYYRQKVEVSRRMSAVRRQATSKRAETREVADWVKQLIEQFGHDPEELYEDEMPEELEQLLQSPVVKGLLQGVSKGNAPQGEGESAPPSGGWF